MTLPSASSADVPAVSAAGTTSADVSAARGPAGPAARRLAAALVAFLGLLMVALDVVVDPTAIDETMMPRLLAASLVLLAATGLLAAGAAARWPAVARLDPGVLAEPVVLFFAGYTAVTALSLLVAFNPSAGLTDACRALCTLVTLAVACLLLPPVPRWRERFLRVAVVAGCGLAAVGIWQIAVRLAAPTGFDLRDRHRLEEITGLMSNVNLFAGMLALSLPWCVAAATILRGPWRLAAAVVCAAELPLLIVLQSRGAWLATVAAAATASLLVAWRPESVGLSRRARGRILAGWGILAALLAATVAVAPAESGLARRFRSLFDETALGPDGGQRDGGRLMIWRVTAEMIGDHLLTGVGAGNFTLRLPEYFVDESLDFSAVNTNWLEPHNDFLWVFAEKGLAGVLLFAGCFVAAARAVGRGLAPGVTGRRLAVACAAGLAAYVVLSAVDFPLERMTHQVSLALLLAIAAVTGRRAAVPAPAGGPAAADEPARAAAPGRGRAAILALASPAVVLLGLSAAYAAVALRQEKDVIAQRRAWRDGDYQGVLAASRRADIPWKTLDPYASPVAFLEGMALVKLGRQAEAIAAFERAMDQNPNRMYVANNLAIQYLGAGRIDEALELFAMLCDAYPHRIEPINNFAGCLIEAGRYADAAAVLEQIPEDQLTPDIRRNIEFARSRAAAAGN